MSPPRRVRPDMGYWSLRSWSLISNVYLCTAAVTRASAASSPCSEARLGQGAASVVILGVEQITLKLESFSMKFKCGNLCLSLLRSMDSPLMPVHYFSAAAMTTTEPKPRRIEIGDRRCFNPNSRTQALFIKHNS